MLSQLTIRNFAIVDRLQIDEHGVIPRELGTRLAPAAAFRNLVAHQYGVLDWRRVHALAASDLDDLDAFCAALARGARGQG